MSLIKEIRDEPQFQEELGASSTKLVVVDFTATWCGPCQRIAPFYEQMSQKYPRASFLKVDVDKCQETAVNQHVSVMPTFYFFRNKVKVDSIQGADPTKLEEKIKKYYDADGETEEDVGVAGHDIPTVRDDSPNMTSEEEEEKEEIPLKNQTKADDSLSSSSTSQSSAEKLLSVSTSGATTAEALLCLKSLIDELKKRDSHSVFGEFIADCLRNSSRPEWEINLAKQYIAEIIFKLQNGTYANNEQQLNDTLEETSSPNSNPDV